MSDDLPEGWCWSRFGDVARIASNLVDPRDTPDAIHIAPNHIESWSGRLLGRGTVAGDDVKSAKHAFRSGQVLYSKIRPYLAKATLVDFEGVCSADMYPIDALPERIDPRFLLAWMLTPDFTEAASGRQGRTVLPKINQDALNELNVPVPPIDEQRRIVAKLDALRARSRRAKEALDAVPALLDRVRQSILAAAFRGDLTADWRAQNPDVEPASELLKRIRIERRKRWEEAELAKMVAKGKPPKDDRWKAKYVEPEPVDESELPELPEGWCWASVEQLVMRVTDGTHLPPKWSDAGLPFLVIRDVASGEIDWSSVSKWVSPEEHARITAHAEPMRGDVLYTAVGSYGIPVVVRDERKFAFQRHIAHLVRPLLDPDYLALCLRSPHARSYADRVARGNAQKTVTLGDLRLLPIPVAPEAEQQRLRAAAEGALGMCATLDRNGAEVASDLADLDAAILAAAFRGELVSRDDSSPDVLATGS